MSEGSSYRQILRSSSIIGGASVVSILVGLLRLKAAAVLLGPTGVGLIGLLQSLMAAASAISSFGFGTVGTRQIAEAAGRNDAQGVAAARRALAWGTFGLAAMGATVFWLLRHLIAEEILGDDSFHGTVGWLAVGVALTVASGSQAALLTGMRRIGDIARVSILSATISALLSVGALWMWGEQAMLAFILAMPLASFVFGYWFVSRLPALQAPPTPLPQLMEQWRVLAKLGVTFMVAGVTVSIGQLAVRTMVQRELGPEALGNFQAAWTISMTYIGFVLHAMGTDYYPRLTAAIADHEAANRLVNEQSEVALLLAGPVLVAVLAMAPWIIDLLYSNQFDQAVNVLRLQVIGDILKVASWPLGFIMLAAGDGRTFMLTEFLGVSTFVAVTWAGLLVLGIDATGVAFICMYAIYLPVAFVMARRRTGFAWKRRVHLQLVLVLGLALVTFAVALCSERGGAGFGVVSACLLGLQGVVRLGQLSEAGGAAGRLAKAWRVVSRRSAHE